MLKVISTPSDNFDDRPPEALIDFLIFHYTACPLDLSLRILTQASSSPVSAHYLICEKGQVYSLVPEEKRAWHAGKSYWKGRQGLNASSIGIELVNPGYGPEYRSFSHPQIDSLMTLSHEILKRHSIPATHILGHSDIAPGRKTDPGPYFKWQHFRQLLAQKKT